MAYYIRSLPWKKKSPQWKVQFISYKKKDSPDSCAKKPKKEWDIPKDRWRSLGFHSGMSADDATSRATQLNSQLILKRQEERIRKLELDRRQEQIRNSSMIPDEFLIEFELRFLRARDSETIGGKRKTTRARSIWKAAQQMIMTVGIDPSEWFYSHYDFYDYFHQRQFSLRYAHAILAMANLWGFFYSRKLARPFLAVPRPRGYERQRILDAYYKKTESARKASAPLTPELLATVRDRINQQNFGLAWFAPPRD